MGCSCGCFDFWVWHLPVRVIVRDTSNDIVNTIRPWSVMQRYRPNVETKRVGTDCGNEVVKNGNPNFYHKTIAKVSVGLLQSKQKTQFRKRFSEYKTIPYETSVPIRHVRYLFRLDSTACRLSQNPTRK